MFRGADPRSYPGYQPNRRIRRDDYGHFPGSHSARLNDPYLNDPYAGKEQRRRSHRTPHGMRDEGEPGRRTHRPPHGSQRRRAGSHDGSVLGAADDPWGGQREDLHHARGRQRRSMGSGMDGLHFGQSSRHHAREYSPLKPDGLPPGRDSRHREQYGLNDYERSMNAMRSMRIGPETRGARGGERREGGGGGGQEWWRNPKLWYLVMADGHGLVRARGGGRRSRDPYY